MSAKPSQKPTIQLVDPGVKSTIQLNHCDLCAVRNEVVCGALDRDELSELNKIAKRKQFRRGQVIMSDDMPVDFFCNILSGVVKLNKTSEDGRQSIVGLLFPPDFLGRLFANRNAYFAEAITDVELCCFPHAAFEKLVRKYEKLEHRLFEHTLDELDCARDWMFLLGRRTAEEKVASFILLVAKRSAMIGCNGSMPFGDASFELPLSRADIADYLGLTIETVSRQITKLKKTGVIDLTDQRRIKINHITDLQAVANQEIQ